MISKRAQELINKPSAIIEAGFECASSPYDKKTNPEGYLNFGIAQNHLMDDLLIKKINTTKVQIDSSHIQYNWLQGRDEFRESFAKFLEKQLNIKKINPDYLTIQTGVSAICECLSYALFDKNDYLMLASPYYTGFEHDFTKRFGVKLLKVYLDEKSGFKHSIKAFRETYKSAKNKERIKAILITHPHNPTGEILEESFLNDIVNFAKKNKLQIITDEIYAKSTFDNHPHTSLYQIAQYKGVECHLLYGLAKDFALAGFKIGLHYSENKDIVKSMQALSYFHPVSSHTQELMTLLLNDSVFLEQYFNLNSERLHKLYHHIITELDMFNFIESEAGLFMLLDLSSLVSNFKQEDKLYRLIMNKYKINMTPGRELGMNRPGYFRVCFAKESDEVSEFCSRMKRFYNNEILK